MYEKFFYSAGVFHLYKWCMSVKSLAKTVSGKEVIDFYERYCLCPHEVHILQHNFEGTFRCMYVYCLLIFLWLQYLV